MWGGEIYEKEAGSSDERSREKKGKKKELLREGSCK